MDTYTQTRKSFRARKKPIQIQAIKFYDNIDIVERYFPDIKIFSDIYKNKTIYSIWTLEGRMTLTNWDYVIRGVNWEYYPCKPDIFEKTYEIL